MSGKFQPTSKKNSKGTAKILMLLAGILVVVLLALAVAGWFITKEKTMTWDAFVKLSPEEQDAFFLKFDTPADFAEWMENAKGKETTASGDLNLPWENGGKTPQEYLWDEFQSLSPLQQEMFFESFATQDAFEEWMERVRNGEEIVDTTDLQNTFFENPDAYTYEQFINLTEDAQEIFVDSFETYEDFLNWMAKVQPQETEAKDVLPWESEGRSPSEYTLEEFENLAPELQEAFFDSFHSPEAFEQWMNSQNG